MRRVEHRFVEFIPEHIEANTLYISIEYTTVVHSCLCGCGQRVVTPLSPTDWHLTYDGETVSLSRSVGNWSFPCQSHYWIERNRVHWASAWSKDKIEANRARDRQVKRRYYDGDWRQREATLEMSGEHDFARTSDEAPGGWRRRLRSWLSRR